MKASSDASPCQPDNGPFASDSALQQSAKPNRPYASKAYWERRFEKTESFFEWYAGWKQLAFVVFDTVLPVLREQQGRCRENRERDLDLNCCAVGEDWSNSQRRSVREVSESTETTPSCGDSCSVKSRPDHRSEGGSSEAGGFSQGHRLTVFHGDQSATELPKCDSEVNSASQWQTHLKQRIHPGDSAGSYRPAVTVMLGCGTSCLSLDLEEHGRFPLVLNIDFCRKPLEQLRHRARFPLSLGCPSFQATAGNGVSPDGCRDGELFKASASASQTQLPSWGQATPAASGEFPSKTKSTAGVQPPSHLLHSFESDSETRRGPNAGRGQVWLEADARALPLRTGSVDLVIDKGLLDAVASRDGKTGSDAETAARIRSVLQETGRVLDPKGCLLLITHSSSKAVKYLACALCSMYGVGNSGLDSLRNSTKNDRDPHAVADRSQQGGGRVMEQELNSLQEAVPPLTHAVCEADEATHRTRRCLLSRNQCSCGQYWDILREDTVALSPAVAVANLVNVALSGHRGETPSPQESTGNETDATQLLASKVGKPGENSEDSEATQRHERNAAIRQWQTLQIARRFFRLARARVSVPRSPRSDAPRSSLDEQSLETSLGLSDGGRVERTVTNGADADNGVGESDQNGAPALHLREAPGESRELRVDRKDQGPRQGQAIGEGIRVSEAECVSREETGDNGEKCGTEERSGACREQTPVDTWSTVEKKKTDIKSGLPLSSAKSYDTHLLRSVVYAITLRKRNLTATLDSETNTDESLYSTTLP